MRIVTAQVLALILAFSLSGCLGSGGGGTTAATTPAPATPSPAPVVNPTTAVIKSNMAVNYESERVIVVNAIQQCAAQYGASGAMTVCCANAKQAAVQNFLNTSIANIQTVNNSTRIDKTALATEFSTYQSQDLNWLSVSTIGPTTTQAIINSASGAYQTSVKASYSNALLQLNAM